MRRWTLRRRLVTVLVALLVVVAAVTGLISTLALRATLIQQVDDQVRAAGERAGGAREGPRGGGPQLPEPGPRDGFGDGRPPPGLGAPGQGAGTISLAVADRVTEAAYIDEAGDYQPLTAEQEEALAAVPADGEPRRWIFPDSVPTGSSVPRRPTATSP